MMFGGGHGVQCQGSAYPAAAEFWHDADVGHVPAIAIGQFRQHHHTGGNVAD